MTYIMFGQLKNFNILQTTQTRKIFNAFSKIFRKETDDEKIHVETPIQLRCRFITYCTVDWFVAGLGLVALNGA